jgi:S1-C subfamily serine protease
LHLDASAEGVIVLEVADGSLAQNLGFRRGDVIAAVNNEKIERTRDLERAAKDSVRRWTITIVRGGQQISVTLGG